MDTILQLRLDDAPLILSSVYTSSDLKVSWPKQTLWTKPDKLSKKVAEQYDEKMEWILRQYKALQKQDDLRAIAPHVLPYAAKVAIELRASRRELLRNNQTLQSIPLKYTRQLSKSLSENMGAPAGKVITPRPSSTPGGPGGSLVKNRKRIQLVEAQPLNEFELVALGAYPSSGLSWTDNLEVTDELAYDVKEQHLRYLLAQDKLDSLNYWFEIVAEPLIVRELSASQIFNQLDAQEPTPAHGYNIPKINDGGMIERCFDMSYELYSILQQARPEAAQLSCLYGHRQRYLGHLTVKELSRLYDRQLKVSAPALNIIKFMRKEISLKHQTVHAWFDDKKEKV